MHEIGGLAGADDGLAGVDLDPLAALHQRGGITLGPKNLGEPVAQGGFLLFEALMLRDDLVLAPLQRTIQLGNDADLLRDEFARSQGFFGQRWKMHQHQFDAAFQGAALDLRETLGRR
jgi:hypothetical protein